MSRAKTVARRKPVYLSTLLKSLGACRESIAFARSRRGKPGGLRATYLTARGAWIEWLASTLGVDSVGSEADVNVFLWAEAGSREEAAAARRMYPYARLLAALERAVVAS